MLNKSDIKRVKAYIATLNPTLGDKIAFHVLPFRKKLVLKNLHIVFEEALSKDEIYKLAQCFYGHMIRSLQENIAMRFMTERTLRQKAELVGHEAVMRIAEQNTGIILLTGHFGNWELAPIAGILNFQQFNGYFHFIRKSQSIAFLEKIFFRRFKKAGIKIIPPKNSLNKICEVLDNHDGIVYIMDQYADPNKKDGLLVEFFGKKTGTYRSLAMVAKYTGTPVIPTCAYRKPNGKHVLQFFNPIAWISHDDADTELAINTRAYNQALERMILDHPEQWLWMYNRWKGI